MLAARALAGDLYINGTLVQPTALAGRTLEGTNVRFDAQGNIHIDASRYKIELVPPPNPVPAPVVPQPAVVPYGRWWLVTEDTQSAGHIVEVWINGMLVTTVRSGDGGKLLELSRWLQPGSNAVVVKSSSSSASGGVFAVYLGEGSANNGPFRMPSPAVSFEIGASRSGPYQREYTLLVQ